MTSPDGRPPRLCAQAALLASTNVAPDAKDRKPIGSRPASAKWRDRGGRGFGRKRRRFAASRHEYVHLLADQIGSHCRDRLVLSDKSVRSCLSSKRRWKICAGRLSTANIGGNHGRA